ncbi:hypothetical protein WEN_02955 [Mycoplasma wenyonii str. Massachusetts]|uniref:Uncharacterized protein n=1 Tax=Mycoplasma wenyonii (strain Massachusetts) TaxID=1197325 RepID=I6YM49_MYCWM|nr:hypothetical protein [Mycoplasma wenyonii]AFN65374.1 hypothetical protein WEN_02955 [Mycoplasma wenyonii str. Massachusetts]
MSALTRAFQFFSGLGLVSTTPFAVKFANKQEVTVRGIQRLVKEDNAPQEVIPKEVIKDLQQGEVIKEIKAMMKDDRGDPSCFWMPNQQQSRGYEFLMCVYTGKLESPILFHYDVWRSLGSGRQVRQVEHIVFTQVPSQMKFKSGETVNVPRTAKLYLTTQLLRKNDTLIPEKHCKITGGVRNYKLNCSDKDIGGVQLDKLHQNRHTTLSR